MITVTNLSSDPLVTGSLPNAINTANGNMEDDIIDFIPGLSGEIVLNSQLEITDNLTINGPGASHLAISGGNGPENARVRVFLVRPEMAGPAVTEMELSNAPIVTLSGLTIKNGVGMDAPGLAPAAAAGNGWGGGIYNVGGDITLDGIHMIDNLAKADLAAGGAVANEFGGTVTVTRSHFGGNVASGRIIGVGGAFTSDTGVTAEGTTTSRPTLTIAQSSFVGNEAQAETSFQAADGPFPQPGTALGGAVINLSGSLTVTASTFLNNVVLGGTGTSVVGTAPDGGVALGGAITSMDFTPFDPTSSNSTASLLGNFFLGNTANGGSGTVVDSQNGNGGDAHGGAVAIILGGEATLEDNILRQNGVTGGNGAGTGVGGTGNGGAVALVDASATLRRNRYFDNEAKGGDGTFFFVDDGGTSSDPLDDAFIGISGNGQGGALGVVTMALPPTGGPGPAPSNFAMLAPTTTSFGEVFINNTAESLGGAIFNEEYLGVHNTLFRGNRAEANPDKVLNSSQAVQGAGTATGGAIRNSGKLIVRSSRFERNMAIGADSVTVTSSVPWPASVAFPGNAFGGAIDNHGQAKIESSQFLGNVAEAGDFGVGEFAGIALGGAIQNDAFMEVRESQFLRNQALGGNDSLSPFHNGHSLGGAISSGTLLAALNPLPPGIDPNRAVLDVYGSAFTSNESIGGTRNNVFLPPSNVPKADGPNNAYGGAIVVFQGEATLDRVRVQNNTARAGNGGGSQNGGLGVGGGIFFFGFLFGVEGVLRNSTVTRNSAIGSPGGNGENGGEGIGGGVASGTLGAPFGAPGTLLIENTNVSYNVARGGTGGSNNGTGGDAFGGGIATSAGMNTFNNLVVIGNRAIGGNGGLLNGNGGNAQGGGFYNDTMPFLNPPPPAPFPPLPPSMVRMTGTITIGNQALAGMGQGSGNDGLGQGGGIYNSDLFEVDFVSMFLTIGNLSSDGDPNIFGTVTMI
ncbi:MAG: hypothetical protein ACFCD0_21835 [Gemmataceae bacterium]